MPSCLSSLPINVKPDMPSHSRGAGVVIYAKDKDKVAEFYRLTLALKVEVAELDFTLLGSDYSRRWTNQAFIAGPALRPSSSPCIVWRGACGLDSEQAQYPPKPPSQ